MKSIVKRSLARVGIDVRRLPRTQTSTSPNGMTPATPLETCVLTLLGELNTLNVVQVGANDGKHNDPIYPIMKNNVERTRILLIEPQEQLLPYLKSNYEWHPDASIAHCAIGASSDFTLFGVRSDCWLDFVVPYAEPDWPVYRAPTGVTSTPRQHVATWVEKYYRGTYPVENVVVEIPCKSLPLSAVLANTPFESHVDLLQVDAESFDDEVIYQSDIPALRPRLINYESAHLTASRAAALQQFLASQGYALIPTGNDTLAIRERPIDGSMVT